MNKYFQIFKNTIEQGYEYRLNVFIGQLNNILFYAVNIFIWIAIYENQTQIGNFTLGKMLMYLFLSILISPIVSTNSHRVIEEYIRSGNLSNHLLKPYNLFVGLFFNELASKIDKLALNIIFALIIIIFKIIEFEFTPLNLLFFIISLAIGFTINYIFFYTFALLTFWTNSISGISNAVEAIFDYIGGKVIPLNIFPKFIAPVIELLPTSFIFFIPIQIVLGNLTTEGTIKQLLFAIMWISILFILYKIIWYFAIRKFESVGI